MIYLSGKVLGHMPAILTPRRRERPPADQLWAADTGCFAQPKTYDNDKYLRWLKKLADEGYLEKCLFATAPDVVGNHRATRARAMPVLPLIRELGYPAAFVAQDGIEWDYLDEEFWDSFDCLFVGGTTEWKLSEPAFDLVAEANKRGKWTHMGRVNSWRRFKVAAGAGFDSVDGNVLVFDPSRPVEQWVERVKSTPGLWSIYGR